MRKQKQNNDYFDENKLKKLILKSKEELKELVEINLSNLLIYNEI